MTDSFFVHSHGIVEPGAQIGERTRVWAFAHVLPGAVIGADCNICDQVFIENHVSVGDRVTVKSGVQLWNGVVLENDVFIGPNVAFTNDPFPRSREYLQSFPRTCVQEGASIGANATILPGRIIGQYAMVGAGAVVTHDVPPHGVAAGNPARIVGFTAAGGREVLKPVSDLGTVLSVSNARIISLKTTDQPRGSLSVAEAQREIPFNPCRYFTVYNVPPHEIRGQHAHRTQHQFLNCLQGSCHVVLDDGYERDEIILDSPQKGLYVPPRIWGIQYKYSPDAVLLVVVSALYDPADYITSYDEFLELVRAS